MGGKARYAGKSFNNIGSQFQIEKLLKRNNQLNRHGRINTYAAEFRIWIDLIRRTIEQFSDEIDAICDELFLIGLGRNRRRSQDIKPALSSAGDVIAPA